MASGEENSPKSIKKATTQMSNILFYRGHSGLHDHTTQSMSHHCTCSPHPLLARTMDNPFFWENCAFRQIEVSGCPCVTVSGFRGLGKVGGLGPAQLWAWTGPGTTYTPSCCMPKVSRQARTPHSHMHGNWREIRN